MDAIKQAATLMGGQKKLAQALGVTEGMVSHWLHGRNQVTLERAILIERLTGGAVRREQLRPDIAW